MAVTMAQQLLSLVSQHRRAIYDLNKCPFTKATYIEILNAFGVSLIRQNDLSLRKCSM